MNEREHPTLQGFPLLPVTVVGSYPLSPDPASLMRSYYGKDDPYHRVIDQSVREQSEAGVHIVSDGQTRASMVNIFASRLAGVRLKGKPQVFREIRHTGPITLADQQRSLDVLASMPSASGRSTKPLLKGIITGPHTMSQSVNDIFYHDEKELAFAFARALNLEAKALQEIVPILQIDEPFFSVNFVEYAAELITEMVDGITVPVSLHTCGDITPIFEDLIEMPVTVLDHEFTANPHLLDVVSGYDFPHMLGVGVVRSDHNKVEPVDWIEKRIMSAVDAFGPERVMVDPDCGLKHVTRDVAFGKLENMRAARDRVLKGL